MKLAGLILFLSVLCFQLDAQYIDENGQVNREKIIADLKDYQSGSEEQENLRSEILHQLVNARKNHLEVVKSKDKRTKITMTIMELGNMQGDFYFLNPHRRKSLEERKRTDTISRELHLLEHELERFQDSIDMVYDSFKRIIESKNETRASKEKAVYLLATSNDLKDIDYLFANNRTLEYGSVSEESIMRGNWESQEELFHSKRTGMVALYKTKFIEEQGKDPGFTNWILLPFFIKYWGDPEWELQNDYIEFIILNNSIMRDYKEPWHLIRFIKANTQNSNTQIMKMIEEKGYTKKKNKK